MTKLFEGYARAMKSFGGEVSASHSACKDISTLVETGQELLRSLGSSVTMLALVQEYKAEVSNVRMQLLDEARRFWQSNICPTNFARARANAQLRAYSSMILVPHGEPLPQGVIPITMNVAHIYHRGDEWGSPSVSRQALSF